MHTLVHSPANPPRTIIKQNYNPGHSIQFVIHYHNNITTLSPHCNDAQRANIESSYSHIDWDEGGGDGEVNLDMKL